MKSVKAKKWFGQHFLTNQQVAKDIAESLSGISVHGNVLEIGPGMGVLTQYLLQLYNEQLHVCEIDRESVVYLSKHYPALGPRIIAGDFLQEDLRQVITPGSILIGNFPYNISTQILFRLLDYREQFVGCAGMFQKEVAERIASPPGDRNSSALSVMLHVFYDIEYLFTVDENDFDPPPKVKSGVIRLTKKQAIDFPFEFKWFHKVVKQAFSQRRKTIRNSFKGSTFQIDWEKNGLAQKRAEALTLEEFYALANSIES